MAPVAPAVYLLLFGGSGWGRSWEASFFSRSRRRRFFGKNERDRQRFLESGRDKQTKRNKKYNKSCWLAMVGRALGAGRGMTEIKALKRKEVNGAAPLNSSWKSLQQEQHRLCRHLGSRGVFPRRRLSASLHWCGVERSAA